jgi:hypothetical protein
MQHILGARRATTRLLSATVVFVMLVFSGVMDTRVDAQQAAPAGRVFASDAGLVLNFIKPDKASDFEAIIERLKNALHRSEKPERKAQAVGWKVFRAVEPAANGNVLFLFVIDPAVKGSDYAVSTILAEAYPAEAQAPYKQYSEAYATGQNIVNLNVLARMGADTP